MVRIEQLFKKKMANNGQNKLGTFGGVFTPDVLTILGVIMYLRLGWVVGNAGLIGAIAIILLAKDAGSRSRRWPAIGPLARYRLTPREASSRGCG